MSLSAESAIRRAWALHHEGQSEAAVMALDTALSSGPAANAVVSLAYARSQIQIISRRCAEAVAGLRKVLQLPLGASQPGFSSWDLMDCLLTAMAIGGQQLDLEVVRWLLQDCQDQGRWQEALNFAGILISSVIDSSPEQALQLSRRWISEAEQLGDKGHVAGLQAIIDRIVQGG